MAFCASSNRRDLATPTLPMIDAVRLSRLRWRCRRGMLENDLVLAHYLDERGERLTEEEIGMLERLLALSDPELWDLIAGRAESPDAGVAPLVSALRGN